MFIPLDDRHLDHNAARNGYLGPSHARCNLAAAAAVTNAADGSINYDGGRNPEVYVDNGEWQPLDAPPPGCC